MTLERGPGGPRAQASLRSISKSLVKVLCDAELRANKGSCNRWEDPVWISEEDLLDAWVADGGGEIGRLLIRHGVKIARLSKRNP